MLVGYMRVSKTDGSQATDLQRDALIEAGIDPEQLYEDQASGKRDDRPGLDARLRSLRTGDTLIVWKLDRLGRNLTHLVETVNKLNARGGGFQGAHRPGRVHRHHHGRWPAHVRLFRGARRVRARAHC